MVRTRIAPSPTGEDLHIGNVYTALINRVFAKKNKGKFVVRIEDTDRSRLVLGSEERILGSLAWFGLEPDEGTQVGGPYGPYRQSERLELYKKYALELVEKGHAYYCFCTPQRLDELRKEQAAAGRQPMYDGACRNLSTAEILSKLAAGNCVIRLKVPDSGQTSFDDVVRGKITFENSLIDDQILLKSDGFPTYHLAVVVDDHLMEITHVIRAEEWLSSTPKHVLLYNFFGWTLPVFAHGPILRNPDRSKLSKRKNPVWASWYKEQGFLPEAVLNYLMLLGCSISNWSIPDGGEIFSMEVMERNFKLEDLRPVGPAFDLKKLEWMNGEYIRKMDNAQLTIDISNYLKEFSRNLILQTLEPSDLQTSIPLIKERMRRLTDFEPLAGFLFERPSLFNHSEQGKESHLSQIRDVLESLARPWSKDSWEKGIRQLAEEGGVKAGDLFMELRVAISGNKVGPDLFESVKFLGEEETLARLKILAG
ncbi:MAG: glutamate--tRNA ligase [Patescibacteria group bacterium]|nr:glutamate--tRNA ligase [Patescibacteria group bacterium]